MKESQELAGEDRCCKKCQSATKLILFLDTDLMLFNYIGVELTLFSYLVIGLKEFLLTRDYLSVNVPRGAYTQITIVEQFQEYVFKSGFFFIGVYKIMKQRLMKSVMEKLLNLYST